MLPFDFDPSIRTLYGPGRLSELGDIATQFGGRALLVADPGIVQAGIVALGVASLEQANVAVQVFSGVSENPTSEDIETGLTAATAGDPVDLIVAIGGGSAMDCAKGINFLLSNGGKIQDYHGFGKADRPMLPSIGVPTTAGTGSEAQSYALISDAETHVKIACGDRKARFRAVILDPELAVSGPIPVKANAGYDAMAHAVESYVCTKANPISRIYGREAFRLLDTALIPFVEGDETASGDTLLGAHLAGMAIEASMLGAAHACANPLTAKFDTTHGIAVGVMLASVVAYNLVEESDRYEGLTDHPDIVARLREVRTSLALPERLRDLGVQEGAIPELAQAASEQWTGAHNPRPVDAKVCGELYEAAY